MNYFFVNHVEASTFPATYIEDLFQGQGLIRRPFHLIYS